MVTVMVVVERMLKWVTFIRDARVQVILLWHSPNACFLVHCMPPVAQSHRL